MRQAQQNFRAIVLLLNSSAENSGSKGIDQPEPTLGYNVTKPVRKIISLKDLRASAGRRLHMCCSEIKLSDANKSV
jgi:hypothetical protein